MAITYNVGANTITITAGTEGAMNTLQNLYDASVAGGWGRMSKQGSSQFSFDNGVRLIVGDGSTPTWFGDTNKLVEISDLAGSGWQTFIDKKANANIRFGTVISGKRTKDGCCFYHRAVGNYLEFIEGNNASGVVEFFSCCFDFAIVDIINCISLKKYNCVVVGDYRIVSNTIDMYNHSAANNYATFQNCSGTFDNIITTDLSMIFYLGPTATANLTISNVVAQNNTKVASLSTTSYNAYLINIVVDTWQFTFSSYTGKIYRQYEFDLKIIDKNNAAINTVVVKIWDKDSNLIVDTTTNASGFIATQTITRGYYNQANGNTLQESSPHTIEIKKAGTNYLTYKTDFTLDDKKDWVIMMVDVSDIVTGIADIKGTGFVKDTHSMVDTADNVWDEILTGATHNIATSAGRRLRECSDVLVLREEETAQGGSLTSITLNAGASAIDGFYDMSTLIIISGTGAGQARTFDEYNGTTKTGKPCDPWLVAPDNTSHYIIRGHACTAVYKMHDNVYAKIWEQVKKIITFLF